MQNTIFLRIWEKTLWMPVSGDLLQSLGMVTGPAPGVGPHIGLTMAVNIKSKLGNIEFVV